MGINMKIEQVYTQPFNNDVMEVTFNIEIHEDKLLLNFIGGGTAKKFLISPPLNSIMLAKIFQMAGYALHKRAGLESEKVKFTIKGISES